MVRHRQLIEGIAAQRQVELPDPLFQRFIFRRLFQLGLEPGQLLRVHEPGHLALSLVKRQQPARQQQEHTRGNRQGLRGLVTERSVFGLHRVVASGALLRTIRLDAP